MSKKVDSLTKFVKDNDEVIVGVINCAYRNGGNVLDKNDFCGSYENYNDIERRGKKWIRPYRRGSIGGSYTGIDELTVKDIKEEFIRLLTWDESDDADILDYVLDNLEVEDLRLIGKLVKEHEIGDPEYIRNKIAQEILLIRNYERKEKVK